MQCPSCHKEVTAKDKDFGALFTCPQCRSVYFLNFDGTPEFGEVIQPSADELARLQNASVPEKKKSKKKKDKDKDNEEIEQHEVAAHLSPDQTSVEPMHNPLLEAQPEPMTESVPPQTEEVSQIQEEPYHEAYQETIPQTPPDSEPFSFESPTTETNVADSELASELMAAPPEFQTEPQQSSVMTEIVMSEQEVYSSEPTDLPQDFREIASEIESFGNQQTAVAGLSYDLEITGLDSKESQELLKEAIEDSRFGWHAEDKIREIKTGTCRFKDLTPVQAFVLARRIQFIDVEMKWKQNVIA
jgi:Zn-finger nucleic acid-binding protein